MNLPFSHSRNIVYLFVTPNSRLAWLPRQILHSRLFLPVSVTRLFCLDWFTRSFLPPHLLLNNQQADVALRDHGLSLGI